MDDLQEGIAEFFTRHRTLMEKYCLRRAFDADATLFREGEVGDSAYLIERGEIVISRVVGGNERAIAVAKRGDIVGEIAPFSGNPRTATARTNGPLVVIEINRESLRGIKAESPDVLIELYERILQIVTSRLRGSIERYEVIYNLLK
jgi:CRP/FNR family transcriptional regulator, cyclic AMP receptor protein